MQNKAVEKMRDKFLISTVILVTFFVSPWNSIDPVNLPKMALLGFMAPVALILSIQRTGITNSKYPRLITASTLFFITQLLLVLIIKGGDFSFHFYGTSSRNTGFLTYLSLCFLLLSSAYAASVDLVRKFSYALMIVGSVLAAYGIAQSQDFDFFSYVNAYGSKVIGTFGNPNFQSAFMGIVAATSTTWVLFSSVSVRKRIPFIFLCLLSILNVALSSQQGYLNFVAGVTASLLLYLYSKKKLIAMSIILCFSITLSTMIILGIFNSGPLANLIFKTSLQARGFYWHAAVNMILGHPFFGVGLDGFGEYYRRARTLEIAQYNSGLAADTAHNIPLDIAASGGFPLLLCYIFFIALAIRSILKVSKRSVGFDITFASIVAAWVAYQAQSIVSINQIGLGVWGWSLTGLIIGYEVNTRNINGTEEVVSRKRKLQASEKLSASTLLAVTIAGLIGLAVSLPPYLAANRFFKALESGNGLLIQQSSYLKPYDRFRFIYTAQILSSNNLEKNAISVISDASKIYPDSFEIWQEWTNIKSATPNQVLKAKKEMRRLDPFNPDLK